MTKYDKALQAVMELFSDTSISQCETREMLELLMEEITALIESLPRRGGLCPGR